MRVARGQRDDILLLLLLLLVALLLVALLRVALLLIRVHGAEAVRQMRRHVTRPRQKTSIDDMSRKDELDMRPRRKKKKGTLPCAGRVAERGTLLHYKT